MPEHVLATDLDGTLIPLEDVADNQQDLEALREALDANNATLTFVTGRHIESVEEAIKSHKLPNPDWIICDVGTTLCRCTEKGICSPHEPYADYLAEIVGDLVPSRLRELLESIEGITPQEDEKQGRFKLSFYAPEEQLRQLVDQIEDLLRSHEAPYSVVDSVDPFNGDGLIDLLPRDVSKAHALDWWSQHLGYPREQIVFAGDSGNDYAALVAGYRTIVVANAKQHLIEAVHQAHKEEAWADRLYLAQGQATSGVLEGCRYFGIC